MSNILAKNRQNNLNDTYKYIRGSVNVNYTDILNSSIVEKLFMNDPLFGK